jgi:hypothetical protein
MENKINLEVQKTIKTNWNAFAQAYDNFMHSYLLQGF